MSLDEMNELAVEGHDIVETLNRFLDKLEEKIAEEVKKKKSSPTL